MKDYMNKQLEKFARDTLKENLLWLGIYNPGCLNIFRRMYSHENLDVSINDIVDNMLVDTLDWAMTQVQNSINKYCKV